MGHTLKIVFLSRVNFLKTFSFPALKRVVAAALAAAKSGQNKHKKHNSMFPLTLVFFLDQLIKHCDGAHLKQSFFVQANFLCLSHLAFEGGTFINRL